MSVSFPAVGGKFPPDGGKVIVFDPDGFHSHPSTLLYSTRIKFWRTVDKNNPVSDLAWKVTIFFDCPRGRYIFPII